ncbi:YccF domain-containing protein [Anaerobacillus sp. MEB173]|uniref:YccF domain-containing protein n=1 Tax=Anaerobacillus sp. MEB173 TaxID=3383345 RepID=UPI003F8DACBC
MKLIGNLLWFFLGGGIVACILWFLFGLIMMITIIGIPFAHAAFRIARFAAFPFGQELVDKRSVGKERIFGTALANFLWIVLAGIWLFFAHLCAGITSCLTIIGIPFGLAHFKLAVVSFAPLGKQVI